jgi:hypothetical protein
LWYVRGRIGSKKGNSIALYDETVSRAGLIQAEEDFSQEKARERYRKTDHIDLIMNEVEEKRVRRAAIGDLVTVLAVYSDAREAYKVNYAASPELPLAEGFLILDAQDVPRAEAVLRPLLAKSSRQREQSRERLATQASEQRASDDLYAQFVALAKRGDKKGFQFLAEYKRRNKLFNVIERCLGSGGHLSRGLLKAGDLAFIDATVLQSVGAGYLMTVSQPSGKFVAYVTGIPGARLADGSHVNLVAVAAGTYSFSDTMGTTRTVPSVVYRLNFGDYWALVR